MEFKDFERFKNNNELLITNIRKLKTINYQFYVPLFYQPSAFFEKQKINKKFLTSFVSPFEWAVTRKNVILIKELCLPNYHLDINNKADNVSIFERIFFIYKENQNEMFDVLECVLKNVQFNSDLLWNSFHNPLLYLIDSEIFSFQLFYLFKTHNCNLIHFIKNADLLLQAVLNQNFKLIKDLIRLEYPITEESYNKSKQIKNNKRISYNDYESRYMMFYTSEQSFKSAENKYLKAKKIYYLLKKSKNNWTFDNTNYDTSILFNSSQ